jgi:hypothetical protein
LALPFDTPLQSYFSLSMSAVGGRQCAVRSRKDPRVVTQDGEEKRGSSRAQQAQSFARSSCTKLRPYLIRLEEFGHASTADRTLACCEDLKWHASALADAWRLFAQCCPLSKNA